MSSINSILAIWGAVLSSVLGVIKLLEFRRDRARSKVELVPVIELAPGVVSGWPLLSVGNSTPNGCRLVEVELVLERTVKDKENARQMSHFCPIPGTGIIAGFKELKVDLKAAMEAVVHALWQGPGNIFYPGIRMWAVVHFIVGSEKEIAKSQAYSAKWAYASGEPPVGITGLRLCND
jgi:hypothetical protein